MSTVAPPSKLGPPSTGTNPDDERLGQVIDRRYRIDSLLGKGGMGVVYRGTHIGLKRPCAIKVLSAALAATPDIRGRFEREALAIGRIDHPNCVGVYDVGTLPDGALYLAMEFLDGKTLGSEMDRVRQLPPARVLHIMRHILRGLEHVHDAGLVHRDIKPENIFLTTKDDDHDFAQILDFGIAKPLHEDAIDDSVKLTQAGMAFGTPIYMAPEQALGNPLDGRADLYSLSVLGYEALTGNPPFFSEDKLEVMTAHTAKPAPPMAERLITGGTPVPAAIEAAIMRGLTKRPRDRYLTAAEYLAALNDAERGVMAPTLATSSSGEGATTRRSGGHDTEFGSQQRHSQPSGMLVASGDALAVTPDELLSGTPLYAKPAKSSAAQWLLLAVLAAALGAGAVLWYLSSDTKPVPASAKAAQDALDSGDAAKAIKLVEADPKNASNARLQLILGHARSSKRESGRAIAAYTAAIKLDPDIASDSVMLANIAAMCGEDDIGTATKAFDLLARFGTKAELGKRLATAAVDDNLDRRKLARTIAEQHKVTEQLDLLVSYTLDLDQEATCEKRREVVAKLRLMNDRRAIAPLERAKQKLGKTGQYRNKPINQCLVEDADAAITYLNTLAGKPDAPKAK